MSIGGFSPIMPSSAQDAMAHERKISGDLKAAGDTKESQASSEDRDADGRQAWRWIGGKPKEKKDEEHQVPDPSGQAGSNLDLSG